MADEIRLNMQQWGKVFDAESVCPTPADIRRWVLDWSERIGFVVGTLRLTPRQVDPPTGESHLVVTWYAVKPPLGVPLTTADIDALAALNDSPTTVRYDYAPEVSGDG